MQSPSNFLTSFTVPTGAGPGTPRVVISNGQVVTYSGPPGGLYNQGVYARLANGYMAIGDVLPDGVSLDSSNEGFMSHSASASVAQTEITSGITAAASNVAALWLLSSANTPLISSTAAFTYLGANWNPLTFNGAGGWSGTTAYNGLGGGTALRYRRTPEDEVWLNGLAVGGVSPSTTVGTLPTNYRPKSNQFGYITFEDGGGGSTAMTVVVTTAGAVLVERSVAAARAYNFNFKFPLGNIS